MLGGFKVPEIIIMANDVGLLKLNFCYRFDVRKSLVALVRRGGN